MAPQDFRGRSSTRHGCGWWRSGIRLLDCAWRGTSTSMNVKDALPVVVTQTATLTDPRPGVALPISGLITNPNAAEVAIGLLNPQVTSVVSDKGVTLNPMDYTVTGSAVHARKVPAGSCHGVASS